MEFEMSVNAMQKLRPHGHAQIFYYFNTTHLMYENYAAN